ncbi:hypothetical protein Voc01_087590 [Virgisporangium ochraceum]|uniref:IPT/TIG domain-containing protein n=1 Tax=Virgisporangium ochraceum TaxID=65505 RepID=A0A8J4EJ21_9ACTN|nr:hypothetical protein Voc01_087590 [Virgisporangium ochraceum]
MSRGLAWPAAAVAALGAAPLVMTAAPAIAAPACGAATATVTRTSGPVLYLEPGSSPALDSAYAMYRVTNTSGADYADVWVTIGSFAGPSIGRASSESGQAHIGRLAAGASANAAFYLTAGTEVTTPEAHTVRVYGTRPDLAPDAVCTASFSLTAQADISASANKVTSVTASSSPQLGGRLTVTVVGNTGTIGAAGLFTATPASYASWPANAYRLTGSTITMSGGNTGTHTDTLYLPGLNSSATDYTATFTFAVAGTTASATAVSPMTHISSGTQVKHTTTNNFATLPPIPAVVNHTSLTVSGSPTSLPPVGGTATFTTTVTNAGGAAVTLDDVTATLPAGTTYVPGSATFGGAPTADPAISGGAAVFLAGLDVPAGASRQLTFQVAVPGTPGQYTASVVGHVASATIDATTGTGDSQPATGKITVAGVGTPPTVTAVAPDEGPAAGGTTVTVTGTHLTDTTTVRVGSADATDVTVVDDTTITARTPPGSGAQDLTVTTLTGTSAPVTFTYRAAPAPADLTSTGVGTGAQTATVPLPADGGVTLLDADGDPTAGPVTVPGQGTYTLADDTVTFTPVLGYAGTATPVGFRVTDRFGQTGDATFTPTVTAPPGPSAAPLSSSGVGTATQTVTPAVPTGGTLALVGSGAVPDKGTFAVDAGTLTFTPRIGFTGTAAAQYRVTDAYGHDAAASYTATVTPPPPPTAPPHQTSGIGTSPQAVQFTVPDGATATLLDANGNAATAVTVPAKGTYTLQTPERALARPGRAEHALARMRPRDTEAATVATITFTPVLGYTGVAPPVQYRITDAYGQSAVATYTPTVTLPAAPPAAPQTSTGDNTTPQHVTVTVPPGGNVTLLDASGNPATTVTIAGQGAYTLDPATGGITFTPEARFRGTPSPVTYRVTDAYGQSATATYTPAVAATDGGDPGGGDPVALPVTGPDTPTLIGLGLSMVLLGAALARRRWAPLPARSRHTGVDVGNRWSGAGRREVYGAAPAAATTLTFLVRRTDDGSCAAEVTWENATMW